MKGDIFTCDAYSPNKAFLDHSGWDFDNCGGMEKGRHTLVGGPRFNPPTDVVILPDIIITQLDARDRRIQELEAINQRLKRALIAAGVRSGIVSAIIRDGDGR